MAVVGLRSHTQLLLNFYNNSKHHYFQLLSKPTSPLSCISSSKLVFAVHKRSAHTLVPPKDDRIRGKDRVDNGEGSGRTIASIVTSMGGGPAAVGIIRVSGPSAVDIASKVFRPAGRKKDTVDEFQWRPRSHFVEYGFVVDASGDLIDEVLAIPMLAPRSYTREDVVEIQCHGSDICLNRVLRACLEAGAMLAEPGRLSC